MKDREHWWVYSRKYGLHGATFGKAVNDRPFFIINDERDPRRIGIRDWDDVSKREGWVKVKPLNMPTDEEIALALEAAGLE
jgi:hypothetical protein